MSKIEPNQVYKVHTKFLSVYGLELDVGLLFEIKEHDPHLPEDEIHAGPVNAPRRYILDPARILSHCTLEYINHPPSPSAPRHVILPSSVDFKPVVFGPHSSIELVDAPHLARALDAWQNPSEPCHCGASAVGVEKHANNCPRQAVEHLIRIKQ